MGKKVYGYHFDYLTERLRKEGFGCRHIAELNFVFRKELKYVGADNEKGQAVAGFMNEAWCNFIKTGRPSEEWPQYHADTAQIMRIGEDARPEKAERLDEMKYFVNLLLRK